MKDLRTALERYREARDRRIAHRKSPWNLVILAIAIIFVGTAWIILASFAAEIHSRLYPGQTLSNTQGAGPVLTATAPFFILLPIGLMLGNWLVYLNRRARRALDAEAIEGDPHSTYRGAQRDLAWAVLVLAAIGIPLLWIGVHLNWVPLPQH
jgi:hypothetical protein